MKSPAVLVVQLLVVAAAAPAFYAAGRLLGPRDAFNAAFLFYWATMLLGGTALWVRSPRRAAALAELFRRPEGRVVPALAFVPAAAVFFAVFLPAGGAPTSALFLFILGISLLNGFIEEVFWRGMTAVEYDESPRMLAVSTALFGASHFLFLFLPIRYEGGALNLVGGALVMGALWLFVVVRARFLTGTIMAHQLVNVFAFTGLATLNGWSF